MAQWGGGQKIRIFYSYNDSDGCCSMNDGKPALPFSTGDGMFKLQTQTLLYFKSMRDELADGVFRSTPSQSESVQTTI